MSLKLAKSKKWLPFLLPNEKTGEPIDWDERISEPSDWFYSNKLDGCRVTLFSEGPVVGRSLKEIPSAHIQVMAEDIQVMLQLNDTCIIEGEFYSSEMNFAEISHFFRSEDVTSTKSVTKKSFGKRQEETQKRDGSSQGEIGSG